MAKNRKGKGKEYGRKFKENKVRNSVSNVLSGRGSQSDFDVAFDKFDKQLNKNK